MSEEYCNCGKHSNADIVFGECSACLIEERNSLRQKLESSQDEVRKLTEWFCKEQGRADKAESKVKELEELQVIAAFENAQLEATAQRYREALKQLSKHANEVDYWQVAEQALKEG